MPFGLASAPGIFHELVSIVLHGLGNFSMIYLDDIIIFSISEDKYEQHNQKKKLSASSNTIYN